MVQSPPPAFLDRLSAARRVRAAPHNAHNRGTRARGRVTKPSEGFRAIHYFLLEYRDRTIDLLYSSGDSGPAFSLPANVYLIGTMNTADRSIALVDAAMRRRFAFLSLHPEDEQLDLVLRAWLRDRGLPTERADLLVELNRRIQDKDFKIGPSYLMTPAVADDAGLDRIWRTSILPLLEEYHVGDGIDVRAKYGLDAIRRALTPNESSQP